MAVRPAWSIMNNTIVCENFEFDWNGGFSITQKQKNVKALHESIYAVKRETSLEVSTKSFVSLGKKIGAFTLKLGTVPLENIFQAAKEYEKAGPFPDLLDVSPKEAKQDERHHSSGNLIAFVKNGEKWPLEPKTLFYDYIYMLALIENFGRNLDLSEYVWFTDIEFNPRNSINCQARSVAIYKLIQQEDSFSILQNRETWTTFHKKHVRG